MGQSLLEHLIFSASQKLCVKFENSSQCSQNPDIAHYPEHIQIKDLSEISGSHGGEYGDGCIMGWCAALMIEASSDSETSVNFYKTARRNKPEDRSLQRFEVLTVVKMATTHLQDYTASRPRRLRSTSTPKSNTYVSW
jgi:hypothetical protein